MLQEGLYPAIRRPMHPAMVKESPPSRCVLALQDLKDCYRIPQVALECETSTVHSVKPLAESASPVMLHLCEERLSCMHDP